MRLNKYIAASSSLSRRRADEAITQNRVLVNGQRPSQGMAITTTDVVTLDGKTLEPVQTITTILFHKPTGYIVSRDGQGSKTIYDLLPPAYHALNPIGRLDKYSSGLLLLTNDGTLANDLTHPSKEKQKVYELALDKPLQHPHREQIQGDGVRLEDGVSKLQLAQQLSSDDNRWIVTMHEGRNRQIRRTFAALGYTVIQLHRTAFGEYRLGNLPVGQTSLVTTSTKAH